MPRSVGYNAARHWVVEGGELKLFFEPHRVPHATDLSGREAIISCGAVLDHLRVAVAAAGWQADAERFPNPNDLDHLATISFTPLELVTDAHRARADAILDRHTDRLPFAPPPSWPAFEPVAAQHRRHREGGADRAARHRAAPAGRGVPAD